MKPEQQNRSLATAHFGSALRKRFWSARLGNGKATVSQAFAWHIPLIVENVRGAQKWVGRARWNYGSFYLWGDVPALMPVTFAAIKQGGDWFRGSPQGRQRRHVG